MDQDPTAQGRVATGCTCQTFRSVSHCSAVRLRGCVAGPLEEARYPALLTRPPLQAHSVANMTQRSYDAIHAAVVMCKGRSRRCETIFFWLEPPLEPPLKGGFQPNMSLEPLAGTPAGRGVPAEYLAGTPVGTPLEGVPAKLNFAFKWCFQCLK